MYCGLPVVATSAGGVPEMIEHEKSGLIAPVKDSETLSQHVIRLIEDENLRNHIIANASKKVEDFDIQKTYDSIVKIYQDVVKWREVSGIGLVLLKTWKFWKEFSRSLWLHF